MVSVTTTLIITTNAQTGPDGAPVIPTASHQLFGVIHHHVDVEPRFKLVVIVPAYQILPVVDHALDLGCGDLLVHRVYAAARRGSGLLMKRLLKNWKSIKWLVVKFMLNISILIYDLRLIAFMYNISFSTYIPVCQYFKNDLNMLLYCVKILYGQN